MGVVIFANIITEKPQTSGKSPQAKVTSSKSLNQPTEVEDNKDDKNTNGIHSIYVLHINITNTNAFTGVSAMNNMKQLEYLMRLHVMIAMVYSERDEKCLQNFLSSLGYVMLIWKVTIHCEYVLLHCLNIHLQNFYAIIAKESHTVSLSSCYILHSGISEETSYTASYKFVKLSL